MSKIYYVPVDNPSNSVLIQDKINKVKLVKNDYDNNFTKSELDLNQIKTKDKQGK